MPAIDPLILKFEGWRRGDDRKEDLPLVPILIKYTASWCGPCRAMPFEKVVEDLKDLNLHFVEIDVDAHPDAVAYFGISSIPAFVLLIDNGKGGRKHIGPHTVTNLRLLRSWVGGSLV